MTFDAKEKAGEFPFRRGIHFEMYRQKRWTMRQYSGFGGPAETNERFRRVIASGGTGLSLAFDLPTQLGLDSDHPLSRGEVGRTGVAIDTVADMERVFKDINLGTVSTSMTINAPAAVLLAFYILVAERQGVPHAQVRGTVQNDILKEYVARGTYIFPPRPSLRLITDMFAWCGEVTPKFNVISVSGYHIREAGATVVQELALTLADGRAYMRALVDAGQSANRVGRQMSFFFSVDNGFLEEIAKFRAARVLWAELMRSEFGADDDACRLRFHCQVAGSTLTAQQPQNNAVRVAIQALSSVLGGTQSLHTNAIDEALGLPTDATASLALRTQQIIAEETGVTQWVDPLAGSEAIETLTDQYITETRALWKRIEAEGGVLSAIESGRVQSWIQESAYRTQKEIETGKRKIVGVNIYEEKGEQAPEVFRLEPTLERDAIERLRVHRLNRQPKNFEAAIEKIKITAKGSGNLMESLLEAARAEATVGEICGALREIFGEYRSASGLQS